MSVHAFWRAGISLAIASLLTVAPAGAQPSNKSAIDRGSEAAGCDTHKPAEAVTKIAADMVTWIVRKTGWSQCKVPPIELLPRKQIVKMLSRDHSGADGIHIEAAYSDKRHMVYLSKRWNPDSYRDRAALLHELVHYLQALNKVKAACHAAYEKQAYELTIAWLRDKGVKDPYAFLGIDEQFIYLMSHCPEF